MSLLLSLLLVISLLNVNGIFQSGQLYSAIYDDNSKTWSIQPGSGGVAEGVFQDTITSTGWNLFDASSNASADDYLQAYGIGFLEGAVLQSMIWDGWRNFANGTVYVISDKLGNFIQTNDAWVRKMASAEVEDEYWAQVRLVIAQFDGIVKGYNTYAPTDQALSYMDLLAYEMRFELGDISHAIGEPVKSDMYYGAHCSSLVKLSPDGKNLYTSHVTWEGYKSMLRIFKSYTTPFHLASTKATQVSLSSYAGLIPSGDDWYITNQNLVVMETTNDVFNTSLFKYVTPANTVMFWIRAVVANRMASTGSEWTNYFFKFNSGTYNNQWIVVDYKHFTPGKDLQPGTLWIAEQIPGFYLRDDLTDVLQQSTYWASYNIPYFGYIYNISGYPAEYSKHGDSYSYENCPRGKIFRRDHQLVTDMPSMQRIMRYNNYQKDPLSLQDACKSISARCDLNEPWGHTWDAFGAVDAKTTDNTLVNNLESLAVSGPSWDNQPPFAWTNAWPYVPHFGQPKVFAFGWEKISPLPLNGYRKH